MVARVFCFAAMAGMLGLAPAGAAELSVEVYGAASAKGGINVALFDAAVDFPGKHAVGIVIPAAVNPGIAVFHDVKPGTYAVAVFHDENGNGVLDKNILGIPLEKYGFSRDASGTIGPPTFAAAAFTVDMTNLTIAIHLH